MPPDLRSRVHKNIDFTEFIRVQLTRDSDYVMQEKIELLLVIIRIKVKYQVKTKNVYTSSDTARASDKQF